MTIKELQEIAKQLNKIIRPNPLINLYLSKELLLNDIEEVIQLFEPGTLISSRLHAQIKSLGFLLPKGVKKI